VLALAGAERAAWALAKEVYAHRSLRPAELDEARARVLVGQNAPSGAADSVRDVAEERAGVHGDDGASRALLRTIASQLGVRAIVVVEGSPAGAPFARVFLAESGSFDAAQYAADARDPRDAAPSAAASPSAPAIAPADGGAPGDAYAASDGGSPVIAPAPSPPIPRWSGTVASLERAFGDAPAVALQAPALATAEIPPPKAPATEGGSRPFYASPWFWGAVGAAVFGGTAVYFATRDNTTGTIHLELQVPK
jgi:hypothetical protein